jgi:transposase
MASTIPQSGQVSVCPDEGAPVKRYLVTLTDAERAKLDGLTRKGTLGVRKLRRAQILLAADQGLTDAAIAAAIHASTSTVERTRQRFVAGGLDWALSERPRPGARRKLSGKAEAYLVALACSAPPEGQAHWTMQLLADRLVALEQVDTVSDETVRRALKKTISSPG